MIYEGEMDQAISRYEFRIERSIRSIPPPDRESVCFDPLIIPGFLLWHRSPESRTITHPPGACLRPHFKSGRVLSS